MLDRNSNSTGKSQEKQKEAVMIIKEGREHYGIHLDNIEETKEKVDLTEAPSLPDFVRGVLTEKEKVIPIIDLGNFLGLREVKNKNTPVLIVNMAEETIGFQVDKIIEVIELEKDKILPLPDIFPTNIFRGAYSYKSSSVVGLLKLEGLMKGKQLKSLKGGEYGRKRKN